MRKAWRRNTCGITSADQGNMIERGFLDGELRRRSVGSNLTIDQLRGLSHRGRAQIAENEFRQDQCRACKQGVRNAVEGLNRLANVDRKFWLGRSSDHDE